MWFRPGPLEFQNPFLQVLNIIWDTYKVGSFGWSGNLSGVIEIIYTNSRRHSVSDTWEKT